MVLFLASLIDKPRREIPRNIKYCLASLLGLCFINIFVNTFDPIVLHTALNIFLAVIGFSIIYSYYDEKKSMTKYILIAALLNLLFYISQQFGFDPIFNMRPYAGCEGSFLGNSPRMMTYFALITPFLWLPLLILSVALGIYTNQFIIFAPVFVVLFMRIKKQYRKWIVALAVICIAFSYHHIIQSLSYRFNTAWKPVLIEFFKQPLIGLGLGKQPLGLEVIGSSYLQFIIGVGILGAVWFGYVFKNIYKELSFNAESMAIVSLGMICFVEYPCEIMRLWFTIIAIISTWLIKVKAT